MAGDRLIVVPYELARLRDGVGNGPERLLAAGAEEVLAASGGSVRREVVELDPAFNQTGRGDVDACFELIRLVAERVRGAVEHGAFPVIDPPEVRRLETSAVAHLRPEERGLPRVSGTGALVDRVRPRLRPGGGVPPIALDLLQIAAGSLAPGR